MGVNYAAVPQSAHSARVVPLDRDADDEASEGNTTGGRNARTRRRGGTSTSWYELARRTLVLVSLLLLGLVLGFCVGRKHPDLRLGGGGRGADAGAQGGTAAEGSIAAAAAADALLPPSAFVPEIPLRGVKFEFPTPYEDTGVPGDMLWNALMPKGSGFVRVPNPRQYDMPASKPIENDPDNAEIYSLSALHQLHCLGVIRDVVIKYAQKSLSRFAGAGHEYHCIDYLRQSIMCAGDMTLDFAELQADGTTRRGFSGANSTHTCRDWDRIVEWAVENREGDKMGIA